MSENQLEGHKRATSVSSGIALGATGIAAFTTGLPLATGILVGAAMVGSGIAAYNYYKALEDERKLEVEKTRDR